MDRLTSPTTGRPPAPAPLSIDQHGLVLTEREVEETRAIRRLGIKAE